LLGIGLQPWDTVRIEPQGDGLVTYMTCLRFRLCSTSPL